MARCTRRRAAQLRSASGTGYGSSADLMVLDETSPLLAGHGANTLLDSFLFAGNTPLVRDVMVAGQWRVRGFHHDSEARIAENFRSTLERLLDH